MKEIQLKDSVVISGVGFLLLFVCFHGIFSVFFPTPTGTIGHDFTLGLPAYFDGVLWFRNNDLFDVPWFSPAFCGGQPFFADPQSAYYSLPQWLSFVVGPVDSIYLTLVLLAAVAFWSLYLFMRLVLRASVWASLTAAAFFMFNGFLAHRLAIGHMGFQGFALVPLIALLFVMHKELRIYGSIGGGNAMLAGVLGAYWLQSGMGSIAIPAALSILVLMALAGMAGRLDFPVVIRRSVIAVVVALGVSASKLSASFSFLEGFPRDTYRLPGYDSVSGSIEGMFYAVFTSSQTAFLNNAPMLVNQQWRLDPHEWSYNLTPVPLLLLVAGAVLLLTRLNSVRNVSVVTWLYLLLIVSVLVLPILMNVYSPAWNAFLKELPLIGSSSSMIRWYVIYLPIASVVAALVIDRLPVPEKFRTGVAVGCLVLLVGFKAFEDRSFYFDEGAGYPVRFAESAWSSLDGFTAEIKGVIDQDVNAGLFGNSVVFGGYSQRLCYNPIFGYSLENYPIGKLLPGPVDTVVDGHFNLKNPACYVFPEENACSAGDHFTVAQRANMEAFANYRPFSFEKSSRQIAADWATKATLLMIVVALVLMLVNFVQEKVRPGDAARA